MTTPPSPSLEFFARLVIEVATPIDLGAGPEGHERIVPITGGTVSGPMLNGRVLSGGADFQRLSSPTLTALDARYALALDDGALVAVRNVGVRSGSGENIARLVRGEAVDPAEIYFRTTPRFTSSHPDYATLSSRLFVGVGEREPSRVILSVFVVG